APSLAPARESARAFAGVGFSQPAAARSRARRAGLPGAARAADAARGGAAARGGRAAAADARGLVRRGVAPAVPQRRGGPRTALGLTRRRGRSRRSGRSRW